MAWLQELSSHPILGAAVYGFTALLAVVVRQTAHHSRLRRSLDASFTLIAIGLLFGAIGSSAQALAWSAAGPYLDAVFIGAVAIGVVRCGLTLFVDLYLRQREGAAVSGIFRDIASVVAYFLVIVVVLRSTLDINLASLVATSAVLTVIVGLALQDVLSNLFSGVVLELEQPFSPGDWVHVGAFEGTVEETGWRTTRLRTRSNELITLPNAIVSKEAVVNFSRPDPLFRDTLRFEAAYEAAPNVVKEAILVMLTAVSGVARAPEPEVWLSEYRDSSIQYAVRYWITDFGARENIRDQVMTNVWYALRRANVRIPLPGRDLFIHRGDGAAGQADRTALFATLREVSLLAPLDDAELGQLAQRARRQDFGAGEIVVREGEPGDSFYVIEHGGADISLGHDGSVQTLGHLGAGDFFGEMSLLAGEERSATVRAATDLTVLVIDHAAFKDIISADPAILEPLSEIAAGRLASQQERRRALESGRAAGVDPRGAQRLHERIKAFFGL